MQCIEFVSRKKTEAGFGVEPNRIFSKFSTGLQSAGSTGSLNQPSLYWMGLAADGCNLSMGVQEVKKMISIFPI